MKWLLPLLFAVLAYPSLQAQEHGVHAIASAFIYSDEQAKTEALGSLRESWHDTYVPALIELIRLSSDPWFEEHVIPVLEDQTGQQLGKDYYGWLQWLWQQPAMYSTDYADFKAELYSHIDPKFEIYFYRRHGEAAIRLDEVVWGGVVQDGIPPLRYPRMVPTAEAVYLNDSDVVFGIEINGDARAYPKRILAWHEFFVDQIGGAIVAGVYCTLCGTVIAYNAEHDGIIYDLGTSGFLYRSNKLMYDAATQSLWSTIEGKPVIGPLVNDNITLRTFPVVTTTWGAWKSRHPESEVLSLQTGHNRDYSEGAAYREYFGTDQLMFPVPRQDDRLSNKDEVMIIRVPGYQNDPVAFSVRYLRKHALHQDQIAGTGIVIVTDKNGAARAYMREGVNFFRYKNGVLTDEDEATWTVLESHLAGPANRSLPRLPSHNIFWFAWHNAYPDTRLVH